MLHLLQCLLEKKPSLGYLGSVPPIFSGIVTMLEEAHLALGVAAILLGMGVAIITAAVQLQNYRMNRIKLQRLEAAHKDDADV